MATKGLLAKKIGMTQVFTEKGELLPVTVLEAGPCVVIGLRGVQKDGYGAVQLGFGDVKDKKLTKPEAQRKAAAIVRSAGVNTAEHLERAVRPVAVRTFQQRVEWCRANHKAWTEGKPGTVATMEGHLAKHILPRFGDQSVEALTETAVQEFVADLKRATATQEVCLRSLMCCNPACIDDAADNPAIIPADSDAEIARIAEPQPFVVLHLVQLL